MRILLFIVAVTIGILNASDIDRTEGYRTALDFINAFFIQKDIKKSLSYVSKDAVFRKQKKGSAIKQIRQVEGMGHITLHEIMFFDRNTFAEKFRVPHRGSVNPTPLGGRDMIC